MIRELEPSSSELSDKVDVAPEWIVDYGSNNIFLVDPLPTSIEECCLA